MNDTLVIYRSNDFMLKRVSIDLQVSECCIVAQSVEMTVKNNFMTRTLHIAFVTP